MSIVVQYCRSAVFILVVRACTESPCIPEMIACELVNALAGEFVKENLNIDTKPANTKKI